MPARRSEIHAAGIHVVDCHGVAEYIHVAVALWKAFGKRLPLVATGLAAIDPQLGVVHEVLAVALDGNNVYGLWFVGMHVDDESEVGRQVTADLAPILAGVVAAHYVPVLLHEQHAGPLRVHGNVMHAMPDLGGRVRNVLRVQPLVDRLPGDPAVVGAERAGRGDRDVHPLGIAGIEDDAVQTHAARAWLPLRSGAMPAKAGELVPACCAVGGLEDGCIFHTCVNRVRVGERWLEVPYALELPRVRLAIVELMCGHRLARGLGGVIHELIAGGLRKGVRPWLDVASRRLPGLSAVLGTLDDLAEPTACLRRVDAVRVDGRTFEVVDFPAGEQRTVDLPFVALAIRRKDERSLTRAYQNSYLAHEYPF